ncbi:hypothetical protein FXF51_31855 [Nonomuraea sp. PA05]|uniref:hypothetical protein n=1 Tax=Nonomuraea sp. PA05 TaxID=2604466 RepID=UPI0011D8236F|nr:hypothetical protein [Nonomuraea sp. PA05]TYB60194.1 hypothetical protein FXF51_31855 [Nonomuraea sp. PA05]
MPGGAGLRLPAWRRPVQAFGIELPQEAGEDRVAREDMVTACLQPFKRQYLDVTVIKDIRYAGAVGTLRQASEETDLLVVGSHGRGAPEPGAAGLGQQGRSAPRALHGRRDPGGLEARDLRPPACGTFAAARTDERGAR